MSYFNQIQANFNPANQSAFGTLEASELTPIIQSDWVYGINNQIWTYNYYFTVTTPGTPPVYGDLYTNNNNTFQILYSSGTLIIAQGTGNPAASGNLTRATGTGTTPIAFSAFTSQAGAVAGSGAVVDTSASRLRIQSGVTSTGFAYITSRKIVRYRAGQGIIFRLTPIFTAGVANNIQLWGAGTMQNNQPYDGYFFGYNGTEFGIAHYNAGTPSVVNQTAWNGDTCDGNGASGFNWDTTKGTPIMIKYPYLGYGDIEFFVQNPTTGGWILAHVIRYANTTATTQITNPSLQVVGYTKNSGNTTNQIMYSGSIGAFVSGVRHFTSNPKYGIDNYKTSIQAETCIINLQNCLSFNGVKNQGMVRLNSVSVSSSANTTAFIRFKIGCVIAGTPSYTAISGTLTNGGSTITAGNSIVSYDTAGTTITGGTYLFNISMGPTGSQIIDLTQIGLFISPGEILSITGSAIANSTLGVSVNWSEDI